jgi:hypothetical protein
MVDNFPNVPLDVETKIPEPEVINISSSSESLTNASTNSAPGDGVEESKEGEYSSAVNATAAQDYMRAPFSHVAKPVPFKARILPKDSGKGWEVQQASTLPTINEATEPHPRSDDVSHDQLENPDADAPVLNSTRDSSVPPPDPGLKTDDSEHQDLPGLLADNRSADSSDEEESDVEANSKKPRKRSPRNDDPRAPPVAPATPQPGATIPVNFNDSKSPPGWKKVTGSSNNKRRSSRRLKKKKPLQNFVEAVGKKLSPSKSKSQAGSKVTDVEVPSQPPKSAAKTPSPRNKPATTSKQDFS